MSAAPAALRPRSGYGGSWRVALRIGRRSIWRDKTRNMLILLMLFVPAYAGVVLVVSWGNLSGTSAQQATFRLGRADLLIGADDVAAAAASLPAGSRTEPVADGRTIVRTPQGLDVFDYEAVDVTGVIAEGRYVLRAGGAPRDGTEVALTRALARQLHVDVGRRIEAGMPARQLTVVGIVDLSRSLRLPALIVSADDPLSAGAHRQLLVDLPGDSASWSPPGAAVPGLSYVDRKALQPSSRQRAIEAAATTVVVAFAGAQVVLLAGAAFMIGARRRRQQLLMLSAVGATSRQVGRVVVAAGLVLGAAAAALGVVLGLLTFTLAGPMIERVADHPLIDTSIPPVPVAAVVLLVVVIGLLAAYLPARTAGNRPVRVETSANRSRSAGDLRWLAGGLLCAAAGTALLGYTANPDGRPELIAAGGVAQLAGIVAVVPALVRRVGGRAAHVLPLAARLATRHAARHSLRTASAVAAVAAAVAGTVALTLVGDARGQITPLRQHARPGQVMLPAEAVELLGEDGLGRLASTLPTRNLIVLRIVTGSAGGRVFVPMGGHVEDTADGSALAAMEQRAVAVGGDEVIQLVTGRAATAAESDVLRAGGAVAFNDTLVSGDRVTLASDGGAEQVLPASTAATGAYFTDLPGLLVSPDTARRLGLTTAVNAVVVDTVRPPRPAELAAATQLLLQAQLRAGQVPGTPIVPDVIAAQRRPVSETSTMFSILATVSVIVTAIASTVAVGLAAAEMRGDLATMVAVGATPNIRRRIRAGQAALIVGLATPLGLAAGIGPAVGYVAYNVETNWHTPWLALLLVVALPPVVATVLAALPTGGQPELVRRAT
ncbi:FtsX-like permease family protein [Dactylosporangium sp. NPDC048998]|uniref:FtsX-like permease family protein n=1 Tax=Dactylosporangium sp. NPDC048998 TaxID=3363976 RepID=UPI0037185FA5